MDFPPAPAGGATATGPRRRLLALSPHRPRKQPFHAPECYLSLLCAISCGIARERAAHASSSVDDSHAVGALGAFGAFGLRREAAARRPPRRKGRARTARPGRACRAGGARPPRASDPPRERP